MTSFDLFFITWAVVVLTAIIIFGRWMDHKYPNGRKVHKQLRTNYQRLQARLAVSSGVIQKGGK